MRLPLLSGLAAIGLGMQLAGETPKPLEVEVPYQHSLVSAHRPDVHKPNLHQRLSHRSSRNFSSRVHPHSHSSIHPDLALPITGFGVNTSLAIAASLESFSLIIP